MPRLVACPSCRVHVLARATECPHCGSSVRTCRAVPWCAGAVLIGLTLSGCPAEDDGESETMASSPGTTADTTGMPSDTTSGSTEDLDTGFFESAAAYGTPDTGVDTLPPDDTGTTGSDSGTEGTDTDATDTGSTSLEPAYGVPPTTG